MKKLVLIMAIVGSLFFTGCSHNMRITNLDDYFAPPSPPLKAPIKIGVTSSNSTDPQTSKYVNSIVDALQRTGSFERVIYPYSQSVHEVDVVIDIAVQPSYTGQGSNFWVNWPGFLIWAPAIWGYGYNAEIETKANITNLKGSGSQQITVPVKYKFRQAEIDRTWTEIGWLEVSLIPFIGGFVVMDYDPDVTDEFIAKVSPNYGPYIVKKILDVL